MINVNQAPLPRLSKVPLVRASLVKRRYIKYLALPLSFTRQLIVSCTGTNYGDRSFSVIMVSSFETARHMT